MPADMRSILSLRLRRLSCRAAAMTWRAGRSKRKHTTARLLALLDANAIATPLGITCAGKNDGVGAQIQAIMSTICFCRALRIPYVHTPLAQAQHIKDVDEIARWESLFRLGSSEPGVEDYQSSVVDMAQFVASPALWKHPRILRCEHMHHFTDKNAGLYSPSFQSYAESMRQR